MRRRVLSGQPHHVYKHFQVIHCIIFPLPVFHTSIHQISTRVKCQGVGEIKMIVGIGGAKVGVVVGGKGVGVGVTITGGVAAGTTNGT